MFSVNNFDPTAGERARALHEGRVIRPAITDPTAGERAGLIDREAEPLLVTDPTNPRYGEPLEVTEDPVA